MHPGNQTAVKSDHFQGNSDLPFHRAVPSCRASEVALIGSLMLSASNEQAFLDLKSRTRPEWFFYPDCRAVAEAIEKLHRDGKPVDAVVLQAAMADAGVKVETGGVGFLAECLQSVPDYHNGAAYADVVREKARLRACLTVGGEIVKASQGTNPSADDICVKAIDRLVRIQSQGNMATVQPIDRLAMDVYEDMDSRQTPLLTTGYTMLDREVSGIGEGETVIVAARPSMGKGILRNGMMLGMAKAGIPVCIISLEDRKKKILRNMLSALSNVENGKLRTGFSCMTPDEIERVRDAVAVISKLPITIIDDAFGVGEVCAAISGAVARHGCKVVSIDYLQLIEPDREPGMNREQAVSSVSRRMVQTCRRLGYRQIMLAQINRSVESTWKASPKKPVPPAPTMAMLRECVTGDTILTLSETGRQVPIRDIKPGDHVVAVDANLKTVHAKVADVWETGVRATLKITTKAGRSLTATGNHPFLTPTGYVEARHLAVGDTVAGVMRMPEPWRNNTCAVAACRFMGYMVGNGTFQNGRGVGFIASDEEVMADCKAIVGKLWPSVTIRTKVKNDRWEDVVFAAIYENGHGKMRGNPIRNWLREIGVEGQRDCTKRVPDFVFESGRDGICNFIAGYLATDGCVKRQKGSPWGDRWAVHFDTVSRGLADDIQSLLARIGVASSIGSGYTSKKATKPIYRIAVSSDQDNMRVFCCSIPVRGKKGVLLGRAACPPTFRTGGGALNLPREVSAYAATLDIGWRDQGKRMRRDVCRRLAVESGDRVLWRWVESDLLWDEIASIEEAGNQPVYDISIPETGCFVANGLVVHNSGQIEQDADGILFIHRPDYYLSEHAKATGSNVEYSNTAEIHIAKWKDAERNKIVRLHSAMQFQRFDDFGPDDMSLGDWSNAKAADTPANRIGKVEACGDFSWN